jgi:hypothetical protein
VTTIELAERLAAVGADRLARELLEDRLRRRLLRREPEPAEVEAGGVAFGIDVDGRLKTIRLEE